MLPHGMLHGRSDDPLGDEEFEAAKERPVAYGRYGLAAQFTQMLRDGGWLVEDEED